MPTTLGQRRLDLPEAQLLSDLYGIIRDLKSVSEFCQRLVDAFTSAHQDLHLIDALSTASVVRYCRCFEVGVRAKLSRDSVRAVDARFTEFHDYLFSLRQKHLSHSVNEFEENCVAASVVEPPSPPEIHGIVVVGGRVAGLDRKTASNLQELASKLREAAEVQYKTQKDELKSVVDAMPLDKVYRFPVPRAFQPDWRRASRKRPRK